MKTIIIAFLNILTIISFGQSSDKFESFRRSDYPVEKLIPFKQNRDYLRSEDKLTQYNDNNDILRLTRYQLHQPKNKTKNIKK